MLNVNQQTLGGVVTAISFGREPLPWMRINVKARIHVWDRNGRRAEVYTNDTVIIQGDGNVKDWKPRVKIGSPVFIIGARVPGFSVAGDARFRGSVLLASVFRLLEGLDE